MKTPSYIIELFDIVLKLYKVVLAVLLSIALYQIPSISDRTISSFSCTISRRLSIIHYSTSPVFSFILFLPIM